MGVKLFSGLHRGDGKRNNKGESYISECLALGDGKTYNKLEQISGNCQLEGIHGRVLDMKVEIDRTYSGMVCDAIAIRKAKIKTSTDKLQLRLILDKYSV